MIPLPRIPTGLIGKILLVLLAIANVGLFAWSQADRLAADDLERKLVTIRTGPTDAGSTRSPAELRREVEDTEMKLALAGLAFPVHVDAIAVQDHAVQAAARTGVTLTALQLQPEGIRSLAGTSFPTSAVSIRARGDATNLIAFVGQMERGVYDSMVLERLKIAEGENIWQAEFDAVIYRRPGGGGG